MLVVWGRDTTLFQKQSARIGVEVSFKIGIERQLVGILISAPHWISLDAICIKTLAHWNKTAAVWLPRKALQKSCVHTR